MVDVTNTTLVLRTAVGDESVITVLNVGDDLSVVPSGGAVTLLWGEASLASAGIAVPGRRCAIFAG